MKLKHFPCYIYYIQYVVMWDMAWHSLSWNFWMNGRDNNYGSWQSVYWSFPKCNIYVSGMDNNWCYICLWGWVHCWHHNYLCFGLSWITYTFEIRICFVLCQDKSQTVSPSFSKTCIKNNICLWNTITIILMIS